MKAADVMTRHVISINLESSVVEAAQLMITHRISGLPVLDKHNKLVGIVTEGDLLRRTETGTEHRHRPRWLEFLISPGRLASEYVRTHGRKVSEIMTADPQTVTEETSLDEVVMLMEKNRIKRLPVVRREEVVGIVSRANLLHALVSLAPGAKDTDLSDQAFESGSSPKLTGSHGLHERWLMLLFETGSSNYGAQSLMIAIVRHCGLQPRTHPASRRCTIIWSGSSRCPA